MPTASNDDAWQSTFAFGIAASHRIWSPSHSHGPAPKGTEFCTRTPVALVDGSIAAFSRERVTRSFVEPPPCA